MSGSEMTCIVSGGSVCLYLQGKQKHLDKLFTELNQKPQNYYVKHVLRYSSRRLPHRV